MQLALRTAIQVGLMTGINQASDRLLAMGKLADHIPDWKPATRAMVRPVRRTVLRQIWTATRVLKLIGTGRERPLRNLLHDPKALQVNISSILSIHALKPTAAPNVRPQRYLERNYHQLNMLIGALLLTATPTPDAQPFRPLGGNGDFLLRDEVVHLADSRSFFVTYYQTALKDWAKRHSFYENGDKHGFNYVMNNGPGKSHHADETRKPLSASAQELLFHFGFPVKAIELSNRALNASPSSSAELLARLRTREDRKQFLADYLRPTFHHER